MRHFYTLLLYLGLPLVLVRLLWRGRRAPAYRQRWQERFGYYALPPRNRLASFRPFQNAAVGGQPVRNGPRAARFVSAGGSGDYPRPGSLWIHAVSVGEVRAALPLIRALQERYPNIPLLVTTTTPTGSQQVRDSLKQSVQHVYLPYDTPAAVRRFLDSARPRLAIVMETELWPNLFHACARRAIPLLLANARLSPRSARRYARFGGSLLRHTLGCITLIAAQSRTDALRFNELGADPDQLRISGNIKYDLSLPDGLGDQGRALRRTLFGGRPVLLAASTHAGEEELLLHAYGELCERHPDLLLVLVPRHPERFDEVAALCQRHRLRLVRRSQKRGCSDSTDVFLGDSMGELLLFYAAADVAFVGGSLVERGGHNILEPALLGVPVLFGPHMFNFADASRRLLDVRAASQIDDAATLAAAAGRLLGNDGKRAIAGQRGRTAVEDNRGALARLFDLVENLIEANPATAATTRAARRDGLRGSKQPRPQ